MVAIRLRERLLSQMNASTKMRSLNHVQPNHEALTDAHLQLYERNTLTCTHTYAHTLAHTYTKQEHLHCRKLRPRRSSNLVVAFIKDGSRKLCKSVKPLTCGILRIGYTATSLFLDRCCLFAVVKNL